MIEGKFITAQLAHRISDHFKEQDIKKLTQLQLEEIHDYIYKACKQGEYKIVYTSKLLPEVIKELKSNGYEVLNGVFPEISW